MDNLTHNDHESKLSELPLCQFSIKNVCDTLEIWVHNDVKYKNNLLRIETILENHSLSGDSLIKISNKTKDILQQEILNIVTHNTCDIIFQCFQNDKQKYPDIFQTKTIQQCARILCDYPLQSLVLKLKNEKIDGKQMIHILHNEANDMIKNHTGWDDKEVEQIKLMFLRYWTFTKDEFLNNMNTTLVNNNNSNDKNYMTLVPYVVFNRIKEIMEEFDVEHLHYKIKNNKEIDVFSEKIIDMVDEVMQNRPVHNNKESDVVRIIYEKIAQCFIAPYYPSRRLYNNWICSDCGNHNFGKCINYKMNYDVSICSLCGIQQIDSIILKIKKGNSYLMVNEIVINKTDNEEKNDIDILMQTVIKAKQINLKCPIRNDNHQCPAILSLGRVLIKYKRWLYTVYVNTKGDDNIDKTVQVNVRSVDSKTFKDIFVKYVEELNGELIKNTFDMNIVTKLIDNNDSLSNINGFLKMSRKTFSATLEEHAKIQRASASRIYTAIDKSLKHIVKKEQINVENIDNKKYKLIFIECAESIKTALDMECSTKSLFDAFMNNTENLADIKVFPKDQENFKAKKKKKKNVFKKNEQKK
eukprot:454333_1